MYHNLIYTEKTKAYEFATYDKLFFPFFECRINEKSVYIFVKYGQNRVFFYTLEIRKLFFCSLGHQKRFYR